MAAVKCARKKNAPPAPRYRARDGFRLAVPAVVVATTVERLKQANDGQVTPGQVVAVSRPQDAPLHPCFEWDDPTAAEKYREDQARYLIRGYEVVRGEEDDAPGVIANVCITNMEDERVYVSSATAMGDEEMRRQVVDDAERLLRGVVARYRGIPGLAGLLQQAFERAIG